MSKRCTKSTSSNREQALNLGIEDYQMIPGLNDSAAFIQALAGLVRRKVVGCQDR
jgi:protoheme ferro-lyase